MRKEERSMAVPRRLWWATIVAVGALVAVLATCGGEAGSVPGDAAIPNPLMGDLMKPQYACMRNPADPRRAACCDPNTGSCSRVVSAALPPARH
jgi:hypothetical protein